RDARDLAPHALDQAQEIAAAGWTLHALEHGVARVLQRDVDVLGDPRLAGDRVQDAVRHGRGIGVHHANPDETVDLAQLAQQRRQAVAHSEIQAVARGVLRHEDDLANALFGEGPR